MAVFGYQPGLRTAAGSSQNWRRSSVRVSCAFESAAGPIVTHSVGSGFVIANWPGLLLTARHVVVLPPAISSARIRVRLSAPDATGNWEELDALGVAYPEAGSDVAAVLFEGAAALQLPLMDPMPNDGAVFDGRAVGYLGNGTVPSALDSRIRREALFLRELDKPSIAGMSGGPVTDAGGRVCGIQSRDDHGQGLATLLDFDVLNPCADKARSFAL
jgi:S1-C subfamily serine protease